MDKISITSIASISPLGNTAEKVLTSYDSNKHCFSKSNFNGQAAFVAAIDDDSRKQIEALVLSEQKYKSLDESVLYAIAASREAIQQAKWQRSDSFGINIGSSRGATTLFEKYHAEYLQTGRVGTLASPTTTLGNISSWVAQDLQNDGPEISHSITCSTALHALLNGVAWIRAGMAEKFLVGGSEAPLTGFTIAQMQALKIYAKDDDEFPSRAMDFTKVRNSMILGEGAAVCCLELGVRPNALAVVEGIGFATEVLQHSISISAEADCFQKSMAMALRNTSPAEVDVIVMHAPGTIKGDLTELRAIEKVFGKLPMLTTNKWKTGHTFGASGMLSIEMAIMMMQQQRFFEVPFVQSQQVQRPIRRILVNAVGFGGNAVSILLAQPK